MGQGVLFETVTRFVPSYGIWGITDIAFTPPWVQIGIYVFGFPAILGANDYLIVDFIPPT